MTLLLVQHGKSLPKEVDPEQGLSDEGRAETEKIASAAKEHGVRIARIVQSGKKRAVQTAEIFASALQPAAGVQKADGLNPLDDVAAFAEKIAASEDLMLVGHLPFMERLASFLITGSADKPVIRFQNSGIVCLEKDADAGHWAVRWTLLPKIG
ncbi:MAG: phosphohistidine phosphatase SixA [Nitrospirota bacterium]|nr:phosphohistidine phosphatase SixA [Nitrospirota bacterium]